MYAYRLRSTGESSAKFGHCDVCNEHASEVFLQTEMLGFDNPLNPIGPSYTHYQARSGAFGHKECLISIQRSCDDGYPSCRKAEATGKWCQDTCEAANNA